jgi:hypothetical protein
MKEVADTWYKPARTSSSSVNSSANRNPITCIKTRVRRFRKKNLFASKRNEAKRDPFRIVFACSCKNNESIFSLHFALFRFNFFASFRFVSLPLRYFRFIVPLLNENLFIIYNSVLQIRSHKQSYLGLKRTFSFSYFRENFTKIYFCFSRTYEKLRK